MKFDDLNLGQPAHLSSALRSPTSGDILRHLWLLQNAAPNGKYNLEDLYNAVAKDLVEYYAGQSLSITMSSKNIVR